MKKEELKITIERDGKEIEVAGIEKDEQKKVLAEGCVFTGLQCKSLEKGIDTLVNMTQAYKWVNNGGENEKFSTNILFFAALWMSSEEK